MSKPTDRALINSVSKAIVSLAVSKTELKLLQHKLSGAIRLLSVAQTLLTNDCRCSRKMGQCSSCTNRKSLSRRIDSFLKTKKPE